ncbi:MAG: RtcB family protein [Planctomycetes bacterium]|nr:RtcB family protein [Planctomycetota bacterium]
MNIKTLKKISDYQWQINATAKMRVPAIIFADEALMKDMDEKVREQASNVASLPGIVNACYVMPDAHWGYGFPIGGVAAFDPDKGGIISAGGVGFDIACGVRLLTTGLTVDDVEPKKAEIAEKLAHKIPAGVGSRGKLKLSMSQIDDVLTGGAKWAVENGYGSERDLKHTEEQGQVTGAKPKCVSDHAKKRQLEQVGTLGSGNHYLELQQVTEIFDEKIANAYGLKENQIVISIHCGSRGLGHQIGTDYLKKMVTAAPSHGLELSDRELACAPLNSSLGQKYLGAMRCGINCALANRQVLTHLLREVFSDLFPKAELLLLYDVSHNTCKEETHIVNGKSKKLFVHRKGATRSFGPGYEKLPAEFKDVGQPVLIGGTMGTSSYVLAGTKESVSIAFGSSCHGAGRAMSRRQATKQWNGRDIVYSLANKGILIRSPSYRGIAEEAPGAYKDVCAVVDAADRAKLSAKVAKLVPLVCVKG